MARQFTEGRQCEPVGPFAPPDAKTLLARNEVEVHETRVEQLAVYEACSCPARSAVHYALIPKAQGPPLDRRDSTFLSEIEFSDRTLFPGTSSRP